MVRAVRVRAVPGCRLMGGPSGNRLALTHSGHPHRWPGRGNRVSPHDESRRPRRAYRDAHVGHSRLVGIAQQFAVGASPRFGDHLNPGAHRQFHTGDCSPSQDGMPRHRSTKMLRADWERPPSHPDSVRGVTYCRWVVNTAQFTASQDLSRRRVDECVLLSLLCSSASCSQPLARCRSAARAGVTGGWSILPGTQVPTPRRSQRSRRFAGRAGFDALGRAGSAQALRDLLSGLWGWISTCRSVTTQLSRHEGTPASTARRGSPERSAAALVIAHNAARARDGLDESQTGARLSAADRVSTRLAIASSAPTARHRICSRLRSPVTRASNRWPV